MTLISRAQEIRNETQKDANTAERVGSLLEDIVSDFAIGKAKFGNGNTPLEIALTQDANVKLTDTGGLLTPVIEENTSLNSDTFVIEKAGKYKVNGSISFEGQSGGRYHLMIFKNDLLVCECNPQVEVQNNRVTNLVTTDVVECSQGDDIELYVKNSGNSQDLLLVNAKFIIEKLPFT